MALSSEPRGEVFMADSTDPLTDRGHGFRGIIFGKGRTLWRGDVKSTRSAAFLAMKKANDANEYRAALKPPRTDTAK